MPEGVGKGGCPGCCEPLGRREVNGRGRNFYWNPRPLGPTPRIRVVSEELQAALHGQRQTCGFTFAQPSMDLLEQTHFFRGIQRAHPQPVPIARWEHPPLNSSLDFFHDLNCCDQSLRSGDVEQIWALDEGKVGQDARIHDPGHRRVVTTSTLPLRL